MRRWLAVPLFVAIAAITSLDDVAIAPAFAQKTKDDKKDKDKDGSDIEPFLTPDGVELHGRFHRAGNPKGPIVLLLYPPGGDRTMDKDSGDWKGLTKRLNEEGYHVLRFDWRGHGKSTTIKEPARFWDVAKNPWTGPANYKYVKDSAKSKKPNKTDLSVKDIPNLGTYLPALVEDLAGLRIQLDKKNDDNEKGVSSSSIYVIGAGDAAILGLMWMRSEWDRPAVVPKQNQYVFGASDYTVVPQQLTTNDFDRAGDTIAGAIWLSPTLPRGISLRTVENWIATAPRMRDSNPMMFIWGEKDADSKKVAQVIWEKALVGDPKAATAAGLKVLDPKKTLYQVDKVALKGGFLLGDDSQYKTETKIIERLNEMDKERGKRPRATRGFDTRYYINLGHYGVQIP
jgi:hypothetical protein